MCSRNGEMYSKESELVNHAKRELVNGMDKDPMDKLRLMCFSRGATGILGLGRTFRVMDNNGNKNIGFGEFSKGITDTGFKCTNQDMQDIFNRMDAEGNGTISTAEFLEKLRPAMSSQRLEIIDKAFAKMDKDCDGSITMKDLKGVYNVRDNPRYLSGELTEAQIITQFLNNFEGEGSRKDGTVTKEEFLNYYATISASIDQDAYFDLLMRRTYKL